MRKRVDLFYLLLLVTLLRLILVTSKLHSSLTSLSAHAPQLSPSSRWPPGRAILPAPWDPLRFPTSTHPGYFREETRAPTPTLTTGWNIDIKQTALLSKLGMSYGCRIVRYSLWEESLLLRVLDMHGPCKLLLGSWGYGKILMWRSRSVVQWDKIFFYQNS